MEGTQIWGYRLILHARNVAVCVLFSNDFLQNTSDLHSCFVIFLQFFRLADGACKSHKIHRPIDRITNKSTEVKLCIRVRNLCCCLMRSVDKCVCLHQNCRYVAFFEHMLLLDDMLF